MNQTIRVWLCHHSLWSLGCLLGLLLTGCVRAQPAELTPITVQLQWIHDPQFSGFYVAEQLGYYAEEGLQVTLLEAGRQINPIERTLEGKADFGLAAPEMLILSRAEGNPVRAISTIFRRSPLVFMTLADSGITRPHQFAGKKVRLTLSDQTTFYAILARVGISPDQVTVVDLPSDPEVFASGEAPVWSSYLISLAVAVQRAGYDVNIIFPDDYGVHFYAATLFGTDQFLEQNPDLALRFLRATIKGYTYTVEHPAETSEIVGQYVVHEPELIMDKMVAGIPLINTGSEPIGWMRANEWNDMAEILRQQSILTRTVTIEDVYTLEFISEIYKSN